MFTDKKPLLDIVVEMLAGMAAFLLAALIGGIVWCIPLTILWNFVIAKIFFTWSINVLQAIGLYMFLFILTRSDATKDN